MQDSYLSSFTPSLMLAETLEAIFVQREKLVEDLIASVRESATTKSKHYRLLVGMRGIGKTHTIALLYHRIKQEADLQDKLLIAWLKEEEWGISSWLDLQIRIFRALKDLYPEEYQDKLAADVETLYQLSPQEATARGEIILKEFTSKRTLLILTENFDETLKGLGDTGQKKLRAYLQNNCFITIIATSQSLSNDFTSKKRAFYGFFNTNNLDKLSLEEATNLLTKIAQLQKDKELTQFIRTQTGKDRIKAINHLAGGNHRVYIIFSQFLTRDSLDDLVKPVMQTLDELTPYYQARMQWLSPQQRKIIELLCDRRNAIPVKEISQRCFISHQTASSQLKDLLTKGYVVKETHGRESFYELQEPLMRICLEIKKQRGEPIKLFIDFLRIWYTQKELENRFKQLPDGCLEKEYILKALELQPIFTDSIRLSESEKLNELLQEIRVSYEQEDYQATLTLCDRAIGIYSDDYRIWVYRGLSLAELGKYESSIESFDRVIKLNPNNYTIWIDRGVSLAELGQYELSIESYDNAIKLNPNDYTIWGVYGISLYKLGKYKKAIESFDQAIKLNPNDYIIWGMRGVSLGKLGKYEKAIDSYDNAIKLNPNDYTSLVYRGITLSYLGKYEKAIDSYDNAIKLNSDDHNIWNNLGVSLSYLGKYEKAVESYNHAIKLNTRDYLSWLNRGEVLFKLNRWQEGFESLDEGLKLNEQYPKTYTGDTKAIIRIIFEAKQDRDTWQDRIKTLVELYNKHQVVSELGKGTTENIPNLISEMVSDKAARTWLEVWQEVAGDKPELEIALRFLKTAVEYKETKGDSKVLLQLPKEERDLFITLLEDVEE